MWGDFVLKQSNVNPDAFESRDIKPTSRLPISWAVGLETMRESEMTGERATVLLLHNVFRRLSVMAFSSFHSDTELSHTWPFRAISEPRSPTLSALVKFSFYLNGCSKHQRDTQLRTLRLVYWFGNKTYSLYLSVQLESAFNIKVFQIDKKPRIKVQEFFFCFFSYYFLAWTGNQIWNHRNSSLYSAKNMSATFQFRAWKGLEISCGRKNNIPQHPPCKHLKNEWLSGRLTGKRLVCGLHSMDQREFFCSIIQQSWCTMNTHLEYPPFLIQMNRHSTLEPSRWHARLNIPEGKEARSLVH